ncbi:hypothetical protein [Dichotomicrobium thermohalophilum]|uniref:hypothetical protein n=1 Tax=Dichotomicrobium thermohalophilum TaxID=933063 RepID=UPI000E5B7479|nr:hypothetical protein [Dichotomicrobium thermohalophilum]
MAPFFVSARADETPTRSVIASEATQSSFGHQRCFASALLVSQGRYGTLCCHRERSEAEGRREATTRSSQERRTVPLKPKAGAEPQGRREAAKRPLCFGLTASQ